MILYYDLCNIVLCFNIILLTIISEKIQFNLYKNFEESNVILNEYLKRPINAMELSLRYPSRNFFNSFQTVNEQRKFLELC